MREKRGPRVLWNVYRDPVVNVTENEVGNIKKKEPIRHLRNSRLYHRLSRNISVKNRVPYLVLPTDFL